MTWYRAPADRVDVDGGGWDDEETFLVPVSPGRWSRDERGAVEATSPELEWHIARPRWPGMRGVVERWRGEGWMPSDAELLDGWRASDGEDALYRAMRGAI